MTLTPPFWFNQRQGKFEPAGTDTYRLTAPNLKPAWISIRPADGRWSAALRLEEGGPDVATSGPDFAKAEDAWDAAFELYRVYVVI